MFQPTLIKIEDNYYNPFCAEYDKTSICFMFLTHPESYKIEDNYDTLLRMPRGDRINTCKTGLMG